MRSFCLILLALPPNSMAQEKEIWRKREVTNEKRAAHNVTPHYVAEAIGSSRSGAWHFTWQTVFFIGQMTWPLSLVVQSTMSSLVTSPGDFSPNSVKNATRIRRYNRMEGGSIP